MRKSVSFGFSVFLLFLFLVGPARAGVGSVASIALTVSEMERSVTFYSEVLDFEKVSDKVVSGKSYEVLYGLADLELRIVRMRLGVESIELMEFLSPKGRPAPGDSKSNDRWFQHIAIIVRDMEEAYARLLLHGVEQISPAPQTLPAWNENAGGISAFYFKDPDGHPLEILHFPADKGDPKWHRKTDRLFLGIDHTAIVVEDTETSLSFYQDILGFHVAGESLNYGPEQERLNNIEGARLRISGLRVASGPAIEFLEYLAPGGGRSYPQDAQPNDLIHWQTSLTAESVDELTVLLEESGALFVSRRVADFDERPSDFRKAVLLRDPDGHVIQIVEK